MLERISTLAVPPAWREVWICADEMGHLQAIGLDAAGRSSTCITNVGVSDATRRSSIGCCGSPAFSPPSGLRSRSRCIATGAEREKILACSIRLLDRGFFRIGGEDYAEAHETYGLATIKKEHVPITDDSVLFDYDSKGGLHRRWSLIDPDVAEVLRMLKRRRGWRRRAPRL